MAKEEEEYRAALAGKKIPILTLDNNWHKLFTQGQENEEIKALEERLNEYLKQQGKANSEIKSLNVYKKKLMNEIVSIMFEMKNEMEDTEKKHKNADFYKKLDDDRKKKGCEYAVLVTTLEADNDVFNVGIVDVSYLYEKMYVVRPQFFIPLITLLDNAAKKSIEFKNELMLIRSQSVDITNFEEKLTGFKLDIQTNVDKAHKNFEAAIKSIEKSIKDLEDVRDQLLKSGKNLRIANDKAMELTIRKLTFGNHTMQQMFKDEKARAEAERAAAENDEKTE